MALGPGEMLAGTSYQIVREIGAGGMGVVYEVEHVRLRKRYVAKLIHERIRGDATAAVRMEREAQVLAAINHPNVVQVHDVGSTPDGTSYFVMEMLEGTDLRHAMKERSIGPARAVSITIDVLDALAHVHARGIVHRDIKPENVFLARHGSGVATKVLDFGIVYIFDADQGSQARITKTGGFVGTLYYAAPEQMQGHPAGPANDVYACALVLFEMLEGRGPFDDDLGVGLSRCFRVAPRLREGERAPRALADVVAAALEQDPGKRPSAAAFAAALRSVLPQLPASPIEVAASPAAVPPPVTAAPLTPPMPGPRPSPRATAPIEGVRASGTPRVETSAGVASSIEPRNTTAKRASGLAMAGAIIGALCVLGLLATVGVVALRGRAIGPITAAPVPSESERAPPVAAPASAPSSANGPTEDGLHETTAAVNSTPDGGLANIPEAATTPAAAATGSASRPTAPARPGKARGNAEKDGYFKPEDL